MAFEDFMLEPVSLDPDLPVVPRWQMFVAMDPASYGFLAGIYAPKDKELKRWIKEQTK